MAYCDVCGKARAIFTHPKRCVSVCSYPCAMEVGPAARNEAAKKQLLPGNEFLGATGNWPALEAYLANADVRMFPGMPRADQRLAEMRSTLGVGWDRILESNPPIPYVMWDAPHVLLRREKAKRDFGYVQIFGAAFERGEEVRHADLFHRAAFKRGEGSRHADFFHVKMKLVRGLYRFWEKDVIEASVASADVNLRDNAEVTAKHHYYGGCIAALAVAKDVTRRIRDKMNELRAKPGGLQELLGKDEGWTGRLTLNDYDAIFPEDTIGAYKALYANYAKAVHSEQKAAEERFWGRNEGRGVFFDCSRRID